MSPQPPPAAAAATTNQKNNPWAIAFSIISLGGFIALVVILLSNLFEIQPLLLWAGIALAIILLLAALGMGANGMWYGVLIDSRNRTSLSRLQITLWTILALSAYLAIALPRSMPNALDKPKAEAVELCKAEYVKSQAGEGVKDIDQWRADNPQAASEADEKATAECVPQALKITFPTELLIALGISTTSFAGSTLVQSFKRNKNPLGLLADLGQKVKDAETVYKAADKALSDLNTKIGEVSVIKQTAEQILQDTKATEEAKAQANTDIPMAEGQLKRLPLEIKNAKDKLNITKQAWEDLKAKLESESRETQGILKINATPQQATLADMFQGDEVGNYSLIDISKVQMFFLTIAIILAYGVALAGLLQDATIVFNPLGVNLPPFSSSLNALLGISHAGYLSVKSVDHTKTA